MPHLNIATCDCTAPVSVMCLQCACWLCSAKTASLWQFIGAGDNKNRINPFNLFFFFPLKHLILTVFANWLVLNQWAALLWATKSCCLFFCLSQMLFCHDRLYHRLLPLAAKWSLCHTMSCLCHAYFSLISLKNGLNEAVALSVVIWVLLVLHYLLKHKMPSNNFQCCIVISQQLWDRNIYVYILYFIW